MPARVPLNGGQQSAAQQQDLNKVVEVACLKACILTIVGEGQELFGPFIEIRTNEVL